MESTIIEFWDRVEWRNDKGQLHRVDGPAVDYSNGYKAWFLNSKRHREDGPAIERTNGNKAWYLNGLEYSEQEYNEEILKIRIGRLMEL